MAKVIRNQPSHRTNQIYPENESTFDSRSKRPAGNVSPGLSFLNSISSLFIQQDASLGQTVTGLSSAQRFVVYSQDGQPVLYVTENPSEACHRICCAARRAFVLHVCDQSNQEIMRISREYKCCGGCCVWCAQLDCCAYEVMIESPPGVLIGTVRQVQSCWRTSLSLKDATGKEHLEVIGPCCICQGLFCCCCENKFQLVNTENHMEIGGIFKEYAGVVNQAVTGAEKYAMKFPVDMPIQLKGIALGALFLINFMHFGGNAKSKGGYSLLSCLC